MFIAYAVFLPIAALFITRIIFIRLRTVQPPMQFELHWRHYFLAIGIGVLFTVVSFMLNGYFTSVIIALQTNISSDTYYILRFALFLSGGLLSFIVLTIFSLVFILLIPVSISENIEFSAIFRRVNALASGKRLQIFMIMLISSGIVWGVLNLVLNFGLNALMPRFIMSYGIIGIIRFPIQSFLYAYLFMLPAVIYHHLRLDELSRECE
jgi:hypothetical protein